MMQTLIVYLVVAAALIFVTWTVLLPRGVRARARLALSGRPPQEAAPKGGCGSGGCGNCSD
jgi:hypothetical protein